jgi:hypothetical protein
MKVRYLLLPLIIMFFISCSDDKEVKSSLLNDKALASQVFSLSIDRDTVLVTKNGCVIKIPKGSIESSSNNVKLEIKEALTNTDMVLAGLTTMSGSQALSSGGMIYFNAAEGYKIEIKKQIEVLVPARTYNRDMQVYKGDSVNGKLNWTDPEPLPQDELTTIIDSGKLIFNRNCASCHKIFEPFTAPALFGITDRKSREWLHVYTIHNQEFLAGSRIKRPSLPSGITDSAQLGYWYDHLYSSNEAAKAALYHRCMRQQWKPLEMTSFHLSREEVDAIYAYIKSESDKRPELKSNPLSTCCDSCVEYTIDKRASEERREEFRRSNGQFYSFERETPIPPSSNTPPANPVNNDPAPLPPPYSKVTPTYVQATYYTINIKATGWYNIDILMKEINGCVESELFVRLQGSYNLDVNINLIIPEYKVFVQGGKLKDKTRYGFDEENGKITLPQNVLAHVIAFVEKEDKLLFAKNTFNTKTNQTIELVFSEITKQQLKKEIFALKLDDVKAEVKDSKNAEQIRDIDKKLKDNEKLKPKNCDCDLLDVNTQEIPVAINPPK